MESVDDGFGNNDRKRCAGELAVGGEPVSEQPVDEKTGADRGTLDSERRVACPSTSSQAKSTPARPMVPRSRKTRDGSRDEIPSPAAIARPATETTTAVKQ